MATAGEIRVRVTAAEIRVRVTAAVAVMPSDHEDVRWHAVDDLRCRACFALYRFAAAIGRLADRIDTPGRHPR